MWFDVRKLLANANFQDTGDFVDPSAGGVDVGGGAMPAQITPAGAPTIGPGNAIDPLSQAGAPAAATQPFPDVTNSPFALGGLAGTVPDAGSNPFGDPTSAAPDISTPDTPSGVTSAGPAAFQGTGGKTAGPSDPTAGDTPTPLRAGNPGAADIGQGGAAGAGGGAAAGANAMQGLARALQGVATAAQGGNPQAQAIMNMLRQMQMQAMMNQMGQGQNYNPYMNQMNNPWMNPRLRMEMMRRRMLERQIMAGQRGQPGTVAGMNPPGTAGGRRGR